jgi:hypothetical protein
VPRRNDYSYNICGGKMNIFATYPCPIRSAEVLDDKRVIKMTLESTQLLCNALVKYGYESPYKPTHMNHPCSVWTAESRHNAAWLFEHAIALSNEYTRRYGKVHKCHAVLSEIKDRINDLPDVEFTDPPNCARRSDIGVDYTHIDDVYKAYRNYVLARFKLEYGKPRVTPRYYRSKKVLYVTLKKIESNHNNLRTDEVTGITHNLPEVGERFFMYAEALEEGDVRHIYTSPIKEVREVDNEIVFKTENSVYSLIVDGEHNANLS